MPVMLCSLDSATFLDDEDPHDTLGRSALMLVWGTLWTTLVAALWATWPAIA